MGGNGTEHIHLHGIIWTDKPSMIKEVWKYGKTDIGEYVNEKTINYITKYITKTDFKHKEYQPKNLPECRNWCRIYEKNRLGKKQIQSKRKRGASNDKNR